MGRDKKEIKISSPKNRSQEITPLTLAGYEVRWGGRKVPESHRGKKQRIRESRRNIRLLAPGSVQLPPIMGTSTGVLVGSRSGLMKNHYEPF